MINKLSFVTALLSLIASFILLFFEHDVQTITVFAYSIGIIFINTFLFVNFIKNINIGFFSFSFIFILGYVILHFQVLTLEIFNVILPKYTYKIFWADESVKSKAALFSVIGLLSYMVGYYLSCNRISAIKFNKNFNHERVSNTTLLIFPAYIAYFLFLFTSGSYIDGDYSAEGASGASTYFFKLFNIFLTASIVVKISDIIFKLKTLKTKLNFFKYLSLFGNSILLLLFWHILFSLYVGDRGPIISYGILISFLYYIRINRLGFKKAIFYILTLALFLTVIGDVRQSRHTNESLLTRLTNTTSSTDKSKWYDQKVVGDSTIELALSMRTLNHSIYNVPRVYDYQYGSFHIQKLIAIIPGLSGIYNQFFYDGEAKYNGSSNFITFLIQGDSPSYGDGTSVTADIYLDFGLLGIFLVLLLFGLFIGSNEFKLVYGEHKASDFAWVAIIVFLSKSLYLSRSSILFELSNIVMITFFIILNEKMVRMYRK